MRILALDTALNQSGWSVVEGSGNRVNLKFFGLIRPPRNKSLAEKLVYIRDSVSDLLTKHRPDGVVLEKAHFLKNVKTLQVLENVRGVVVEICTRTMNSDPMEVTVHEARTYFQLSDKKDVFNLVTTFTEKRLSFEKHNDITDSSLLALYVLKGGYDAHREAKARKMERRKVQKWAAKRKTAKGIEAGLKKRMN